VIIPKSFFIKNVTAIVFRFMQ